MTADGDTDGEDATDGTTGITRLDQRTVERIAAGEVVERPASVVKELVENSLDADADRVSVSVAGDGTERIRVSDDGLGMTEADVRAAVREHTTSKIGDVSDLEAGVTTLGFRGEALHTIGAVSRMTITTRPRGADGAGTELRYEGGEVVSVDPAGCPEGTAVEVADLFYNTPARRKYLKTEATEFARINRVVSRYALANPDVAVSLEHDDRETFSTTGQGDLQGAIMSVYGREVAEAMIPVGGGYPGDHGAGSDDGGEDAPAGPLDTVAGYVSHPETNRSTREYVATYVNGRYVASRAVREAVVEGYGGQLASDRYPFVVLFLETDPGSVDVNVHPRKMEVRWNDEAGVRTQVETAVRDALLDHGLLRSGAPRGRSAPAEADVSPSAGTDDDSAVSRETGDTGAEATGERGSDGAASPGAGTAANPSASTGTGEDGAAESAGAGTSASESGPSGAGTPEGSAGPRQSDGPDTPEADEGGGNRDGDEGGGDAGDGRGRDAGDRPADADSHAPGRKFQESHDQATLGGDVVADDPAGDYDRLPRMRVLGQLHDTYVVAETDDGLVLVDQHAADERVNYERLREAFRGETTAQALADPVRVDLTAGELAGFEAYEDALANLGFYAEATDGAVEVTTVPAVLRETLPPESLREALSGLLSGEGDGGSTVDALADEFLADLACYPSITGNTSLTEGSVVDLLAALDDCENPYACPHGRPVVVRIDGSEIDDRFERDYPGHATRRD